MTSIDRMTERQKALLAVGEMLEQAALLRLKIEVDYGDDKTARPFIKTVTKDKTLPEVKIPLPHGGEHHKWLSVLQSPDHMLYAAEILREVAIEKTITRPPKGKGGPKPKTPKGIDLLFWQIRYQYDKELQEDGNLIRKLKKHYPKAKAETLADTATKIRLRKKIEAPDGFL